MTWPYDTEPRGDELPEELIGPEWIDLSVLVPDEPGLYMARIRLFSDSGVRSIWVESEAWWHESTERKSLGWGPFRREVTRTRMMFSGDVSHWRPMRAEERAAHDAEERAIRDRLDNERRAWVEKVMAKRAELGRSRPDGDHSTPTRVLRPDDRPAARDDAALADRSGRCAGDLAIRRCDAQCCDQARARGSRDGTNSDGD